MLPECKTCQNMMHLKLTQIDIETTKENGAHGLGTGTVPGTVRISEPADNLA